MYGDLGERLERALDALSVLLRAIERAESELLDASEADLPVEGAIVGAAREVV